jgi:hypothetical protein
MEGITQVATTAMTTRVANCNLLLACNMDADCTTD